MHRFKIGDTVRYIHGNGDRMKVEAISGHSIYLLRWIAGGYSTDALDADLELAPDAHRASDAPQQTPTATEAAANALAGC